MGRKNLPPEDKELSKLISQYEAAKAENRQQYLDGDQLADMADRYASEQKFDEAQEVISYGLHLHPGNTDLMIEQAYLYLDTRKTAQAQQVADSITEEYNTEVKMLKAELLLNEGQLEATKEMLSTVEEPDELETIISIVYLYLDMGYPDAAKEWLDRGKPLYSEDEDFIAITAEFLTMSNQLDTAVVYYDRLIDIDPYNPAYWVGLAKCRFAEENCDKAIEACDFALAADDTYGEAYSYRAHSYFYLNNLDAAIADYEKAIQFKAIGPEIGNMFMGMAHANKERWKEADACYQKVIRAFIDKGDANSPLLVDTYTNAAIAASQLGDHKKAHQLCKKAKSIQPKESVIYLTEGKIYLNEKLETKAFDSFKQALERDPGAEMWYLIAEAYSETDMLYEAKMCLEEAYKIDPTYADIPEKLSILSLMHNEIDHFFKYNSECAYPISEDVILDLLSKPHHSQEAERMLREVWERMKEEKENKKEN